MPRPGRAGVPPAGLRCPVDDEDGPEGFDDLIDEIDGWLAAGLYGDDQADDQGDDDQAHGWRSDPAGWYDAGCNDEGENCPGCGQS